MRRYEAFRPPHRTGRARRAPRRDRGCAASPPTAARSSPATCSSRCRAPRPTGCASPPQAAAAGAAAIVAERRRPALPPGAAFVKVDECAARAGARRGAGSIRASRRSSPPSPAPAARPRSPPSRGRSGRRSAMQAASIGTIGVVTPKREVYGSLTTPDPVALHRTLDELAGEGITHLAIEASSHGLDQHRLDGVRVAAGGFTNLSRDHLDYHPSVEAYLAAKLRLFEALVRRGGAAVIAVDHEHARRGDRGGARRAACELITVGRNGDGIRLARHRDRRLRADADASRMRGRRYQLRLPLVGDVPGRERAGRRRARDRDRRRAGRGVRRARDAQRRQGPARSRRRSATARRSSSTTPTSPTRWRRRSRRCGPM